MYTYTYFDEIYDEITGACESLNILVEKVRCIKPPQKYERDELIRRIREGDESARGRLVEIYLRYALLIGLKWSKKIGVDLQDAIGDACEGLVKAVGNYQPDKKSKFEHYCVSWMYYSVMKGQSVHNSHISFRKGGLQRVNKAYGLLKKKGCLECGGLGCCNKALQQVAQVVNCDAKESRIIMPLFMDPLSLEAYLDTAAHGRYDGLCEDIRPEENDAPDFEEGLSGYCVDLSIVAEDRLTELEFIRKLQEHLMKLPEWEKDVLEYYYGIKEERKYTFEEIGRMYGFTGSRIWQIEAAARKKLRVRGKILREYLSDK